MSRLELNALKEEILLTINMVQFIEDEYGVYLQPQSNGWYKTNCLMPKHRDNNPSFGVNPELGKYNCLSCGCKGDLIDLVRAIEGLSFLEALQRLAEYAGVTLDNSDNARINRVIRKVIRDMNAYLLQDIVHPYPAQMSEPVFMLAVTDRLKKYEQDTGDVVWVEQQYLELDDMIDEANYVGCERMWRDLSHRIKARRQMLAAQA